MKNRVLVLLLVLVFLLTAGAGISQALTPGPLPGAGAGVGSDENDTGAAPPGTAGNTGAGVNSQINNQINNTTNTTNNANTDINISGSTINNSNIGSNNQVTQSTEVKNISTITVKQEVSVLVNGRPLQSDVPSFINGDDRTMVTLRAIAEALGAKVDWDEATQTITITLGDKVIKLVIGQNSYTVNGQEQPMDTAAAVTNGRTVVPARVIGEALGAKVGWNPQTSAVTIDSGSQTGQPADQANQQETQPAGQSDQQETQPAGQKAQQATPSESQITQSADSNNITTETNSNLPLIGAWSTYGPTGSMVDPVTGFSTGSYYSGEWYYFKADGTCRYIILGKGSIISGMSIVDSKYEVVGNQIIFAGRMESWTPDPTQSGQEPAYKNKPIDDETQQFTYYSADDTLSIDTSTFQRINE